MSNANCKTKKAMEALQSGEVLEVHVTDKGAIKDIPAWSQTSGHEVLKHTEEDGELSSGLRRLNDKHRRYMK